MAGPSPSMFQRRLRPPTILGIQRCDPCTRLTPWIPVSAQARLMSGTREILRSQQGLTEHANYHEYCKLLGRLKTNYQLSELVNVENYAEWIQLVAEFTIKSLQSWQWASGSVFYLLGLWGRLVSSMPYLKGDSPSMLESYVPQITEAYITSRLDSVHAIVTVPPHPFPPLLCSQDPEDV
ncbi:hypothetical protein CYMTET_33717 [Cymbomonas tetramitiformis]|uniref:Uncharacterized protein n=1 Tax=Cymbomonas tetramitiformis TaxID=36881 RepID=A0AAE0FCJ8_9CHLO|nr:hypothetical protein CYMTET_33717 [Cymbomonas tetramitiformis]